MKDFKVLKFLDHFKHIFEKMGVNYPIMRRILNIKLILDGRRVSTVLSNQGKKKKDEDDNKNNFFKSLGMYFLMGTFLILFIVIGENFLFQMSFVFSVTMFLLMTSLIADFSSVLLDVKDKEILLSKPVDSKTLNMAKILHIFMYITTITMAITGPSLVASLIRHGVLFFLIYLAEIIFISLFVIILTALIYLFVLRFSSGEKLKDIINYVQIGLTIAMSLGYQLISRIFNVIDIHNMEYNPSLWKYFFPPLWFAAPFELILKGNHKSYIIIYAIFSVLIPILSIVIYIRLIPTFERNLQKLNSTEGQTRDKNKSIVFISRIMCKSKEERIFYRFATNMLKNERTFKLKVYPSLGMAIIFPFFMMFSIRREQFLNVLNTRNYLWFYMAFIMIPTIVGFLGYSGNYKGAWIYETMPIEDKSTIYSGAVKAVVVNLFVPVFSFVGLIFLIIYKMQILGQILVVGINMFFFTIIVFRMMGKSLPFSKAFEVTENPGSGANVLISMFIVGLFVLGHYVLTLIPYGIYVYIPIGFIIIRFAWKKLVA